jgi:hypothetical protein
MILSHHGTLEYGSPKVPVFLEAMLLHQLDTMDARMECMRASVEKDRQVEGVWTGYIAPLERSVLKKGRYLESAVTSGAVPHSPGAVPNPVPNASGNAGEPQHALSPAASHSSGTKPAAPRPVSSSPFASKLQEALHHEK